MIFDIVLIEKMNQRNYIKFCVKNEIECPRIFEILSKAFGKSTISITHVQFWYNRFKEGREDVNDNAHTDRTITSTTDENIEVVKKMILDNRRITTWESADDVDMSFGSCQVVFTDALGMKHAAAKIVSKMQNFVQKQSRIGILQEMLMTFNGDPVMLRKVITGDESWVYAYDIGTKT